MPSSRRPWRDQGPELTGRGCADLLELAPHQGKMTVVGLRFSRRNQLLEGLVEPFIELAGPPAPRHAPSVQADGVPSGVGLDSAGSFPVRLKVDDDTMCADEHPEIPQLTAPLLARHPLDELVTAEHRHVPGRGLGSGAGERCVLLEQPPVGGGV